MTSQAIRILSIGSCPIGNEGGKACRHLLEWTFRFGVVDDEHLPVGADDAELLESHIDAAELGMVQASDIPGLWPDIVSSPQLAKLVATNGELADDFGKPRAREMVAGQRPDSCDDLFGHLVPVQVQLAVSRIQKCGEEKVLFRSEVRGQGSCEWVGGQHVHDLDWTNAGT